ncbi:MAG: hypothetical protein M1812_005765 [Candelaria pacifica]|nr:MAG: hypothetical protein M1812_005765 [Candelaria pacifica]
MKSPLQKPLNDSPGTHTAGHDNVSTQATDDSPLVALVEYLEQAKVGTGELIIPRDVAESIFKVSISHTGEQEQDVFPAIQVEGIIHALGCGDQDLCGRLNVKSLGLIIRIFLHTIPCTARERGICHVTEFLQRSEVPTTAAKQSAITDSTAEAASTKLELGAEVLVPLIECFVEEEDQARFRRWVGILVLELLRDCEDNQVHLDLAMPDDIRPGLGHIIISHESQVLKQISAAIIQETIVSDTSIEEYWPVEIDTATMDRFPNIPLQDSQWTECFEVFLDGLHEEKLLKEVASETHMAIALAADDCAYSDNGAAITLTICEELNIVVPMGPEHPAQYIDIALEHIKGVRCAAVDLLNSSGEGIHHTATVLFLQLDASGHANYFLNGVARLAEEFYITFEDEERAQLAAEHVREEQKERSADQNQIMGPKISMVSNSISVKDILSQDNAASEQDRPVPTTPGASPAILIKNAQENGSKKRVSSERRRRSSRKTSSGISNTQAPFLSVASNIDPGFVDRTTSSANFQDTLARLALKEATTRANSGTKEALTSSDIWRKGQKLIEDAPEFQSQIATPEIGTDRTSPKQSHPRIPTIPDSQPEFSDPENLYSLSPAGKRSYETRMRTAKTNPESDSPIRVSEELLAGSVNDELRVGKKPSSEPGDPLATYKRLLHDVENKAVEPSNVAAPPKPKLKDRLRNQYGLTHAEISPAVAASVSKGDNNGSDRSSGAQTASQKSVGRDAKGATKVPLPSRTYGKRQSTHFSADQAEDIAEGDVYDIPKSQDPPPVIKKPKKKTKPRKPMAQSAMGRVGGKSTKPKSTRTQAESAKSKLITKPQKLSPPKNSSIPQNDVPRKADSPSWFNNQDVSDDNHKPAEISLKRASNTKVARSKKPPTTSTNLKAKTLPKKPAGAAGSRQLPRLTRSAAVKAKQKIADIDDDGLSEGEEAIVDELVGGVAANGREVSTKPPSHKQPTEHEKGMSDARNDSTNDTGGHEGDENRGNQGDSFNRRNLALEDHQHLGSHRVAEDHGIGLVEEPSVEEASRTPEGATRINTEPSIISPATNAGQILSEEAQAKAPILQNAELNHDPKDLAGMGPSNPKSAKETKVQDSIFETRAVSDQETIDPAMVQVRVVSQQLQIPQPPASNRPDHPTTVEAGFISPSGPTGKTSPTSRASAVHVKSPGSSGGMTIMDGSYIVAPKLGDIPKLNTDVPIKQDQIILKGVGDTRDLFNEKNKGSTAEILKDALPYAEGDEDSLAKQEVMLPTAAQKPSSQSNRSEVIGPSRDNAPLVDARMGSVKTEAPLHSAGPKHSIPSQPEQALSAVARKSPFLQILQPEVQSRHQTTPEETETVKAYSQTSLPPAKSQRRALSEATLGPQQANKEVYRGLRPSQPMLQPQDSEIISVSSAATEKEKETSSSPSTGTVPRQAQRIVSFTKRKAKDEASQAPLKKSRVLPSKAGVLPRRHTAAQLDTHPNLVQFGTLVDDNAIKRTPIISFDKHGPRNQGVLSTKKPSSPSLKHQKAVRESSSKVDRKPGTIQPKRKHDETIQAPVPITPNVKRQKSVNIVPRTHENVRTNGTGNSEPPIAAVSKKPGSRGTRVDENGSPVPIPSFTDQSKFSESQMRDAFEQSNIEIQDELAEENKLNSSGHTHVERIEEDLFLYDSRHPSPFLGETPDRGNLKVFSGQDSLDVESQAHRAITAHRIVPGGRFVNVQTDDVVQAETSLQDPFVRIGSQGSGTFMDKLHAQNSGSKKASIDSVFKTGDGSKRAATRIDQGEEDPEKTLVNVDHNRGLSDLASDDGTTSSSSSSQSTNSSSTSKGVSEATSESQKEWQAALLPHQRNTLDVLHSISNRLVRHLVDQETAIQDIIQDYEHSGHTCIDALEKHQAAELSRSQQGLDKAKAIIAGEFEQALDWLGKENQELRQNSSAVAIKRQKEQQQMFDRLMKEAMQSVGG